MLTAPATAPRERATSEHRIAADLAVRAHLVELIGQGVAVTLVTPSGTTLSARLIHEDTTARELRFEPLGDAAALHRLGEAEEAVVVAYLASIKLQFDLIGLRVCDGELVACYPRELFRFQRRNAFRVRTEPPPQLAAKFGQLQPILTGGPELLLGDPAVPASRRRLRVLDLSHGGLSLLLPAPDPTLALGTRIPAASLELTPSLPIHIALRVVRSEALSGPDGPRRLGCEMEGLSGVAARTLQRWIDEWQVQAKVMAG
ncbi:flagellar brake protein [Sphaerotilus mobilis]|nr:flagellar brake protein [Sphaerotilus mobilis]